MTGFIYDDQSTTARNKNAEAITAMLEHRFIGLEHKAPVYFPRDMENDINFPLVVSGVGSESFISTKDGTFPTERITKSFFRLLDGGSIEASDLDFEGPGFPDPGDFNYDPDNYPNRFCVYALNDHTTAAFRNVNFRGWKTGTTGNLNDGYGTMILILENVGFDDVSSGFGWYKSSNTGFSAVFAKGLKFGTIGWAVPNSGLGHGVGGYCHKNVLVEIDGATVDMYHRNLFQFLGDSSGTDWKNQVVNNLVMNQQCQGFAIRCNGGGLTTLSGQSQINTTKGAVTGSGSRVIKDSFLKCVEPSSVMDTTDPNAFQEIINNTIQVLTGGITTNDMGSIRHYGNHFIFPGTHPASSAIRGGQDDLATIRGRSFFDRKSVKKNLQYWIDPRNNQLIDEGSHMFGSSPLYGYFNTTGETVQANGTQAVGTPTKPFVFDHQNRLPAIYARNCNLDGATVDNPGAIVTPGNQKQTITTKPQRLELMQSARFVVLEDFTGLSELEIDFPSYQQNIVGSWSILFKAGGVFNSTNIQPGGKVIASLFHGKANFQIQ